MEVDGQMERQFEKLSSRIKGGRSVRDEDFIRGAELFAASRED